MPDNNEQFNENDGLIAPPVGAWAERKYGLLDYYGRIFAKAMKGKWDARVYIDLFAGAGKASIKGTSRIVPTSALISSAIPDQFGLIAKVCEQRWMYFWKETISCF